MNTQLLLAIAASLAAASASAKPLHAGLNYQRYLQERNQTIEEYLAFKSTPFYKLNIENGVPEGEERDNEPSEDHLQRFRMAKDLVQELSTKHPEATFSVNSPFTLMTDQEFQQFVGLRSKDVNADTMSSMLGFHAPEARRSLRQQHHNKHHKFDFDWEEGDFPNWDKDGSKDDNFPNWDNDGSKDNNFPNWDKDGSKDNNFPNWDKDDWKPFDPRPKPGPGPQPGPKPSTSPSVRPNPGPKPVGPVAPTDSPVGPVAPTDSPVGPVAPTDNPSGPTHAPDNSGGGVNWLDKGCVTPARNQGQCGSCWAFAAAAALESAVCAKSGNGKCESLSEQMLTDCDRRSSGCSGGLHSTALEYAKQNGGICTLESMPYKGQQGQCNTSCKKVDIKISEVVTVKGEDKLIQALDKQPVAVAVAAGNSEWKQYTGGVLSSCSTARQDHAVLAYGYTDGAILIKNSWGEKWGEKGMIKLKRGGGSQGTCGVAGFAVYPQLA